MKKRNQINYSKKVNQVLESLSKYHDIYYEVNTFYGPSLHFHKKAVVKSKKQYEYIYAVLTSWGMHRMGKRGAKMTDFSTFNKSIKKSETEIKYLRNKTLENLKEKDFDVLEKLFKSIKVMETKTKIVGNSKVIAHLLPKLIPPIDREYTFYYLNRSKSIVNDVNKEWKIFKIFIQEFFQKIASNNKFKRYSKKWLNNKNKYPWDTSVPKIIDNLVIAATPRKKKKKKT